MGMLLPRSATARTVGIALAVCTGVVMAAFVTAFAIHRLTPVPAWKEFVDIGGEGNLPTWWNATLLALVAAVATVAAIVEPPGAARRAWIVVAAAATYLSLDEAAGLHERLGDSTFVGDLDTSTYGWVVPGALLALAGAAVLVVTGRHLSSPTGLRLGVALAAYGFGAVGLEAFTGWVRDRDADWLFTIGITAEETVEMIAAVYAIAVVIERFQVRRLDGALSIGRQNH